jgi:dephospho-CoA kinase
MQPEGPAYAPIVEKFGSEILLPDGHIDRPRLGRIVFADSARLKELNAIVHPAVFAREDKLVEDAMIHDPCGIVIIEAAILIETGRYRAFDRLILTVCSEELQIERAIKRDQLPRDEVLKRIQRQLPLSEKIGLADYVIDTSGSKEETIGRVQTVHKALKELARSHDSPARTH